MLIQSVSTTQIYKQALFVGAKFGAVTGGAILFLGSLFYIIDVFRTGQDMERLLLVLVFLMYTPIALMIGGMIGVILGLVEATLFAWSKSTQIVKVTTLILTIFVTTFPPLIDLTEEIWLQNRGFTFLSFCLVVLAFIAGKFIAGWGYTEFFRRLGVTE